MLDALAGAISPAGDQLRGDGLGATLREGLVVLGGTDIVGVADDDQLVTGLSLYMRAGGAVSSRPSELVMQQIELVRRMGVRGYCLFAYSHLSEPQLKMLREKINAEPAVPYAAARRQAPDRRFGRGAELRNRRRAAVPLAEAGPFRRHPFQHAQHVAVRGGRLATGEDD